MTFHLSTAFVTIASNSASSDFDRLVDFYRGLSSQEPKPFLPQVYAEFNLPGLRLAIFRPKDTHSSEFNHSAHSSMSICLEVDNLEKVIEHLRKLGYPPQGEIMTASHGREIYAYDPAGNRLILHQDHNKI
jgi:Glyoxalase/Bleomycin resistance protein/Dioxygenase superfamily